MSYNFKTVMGQSSYKAWGKWKNGDTLEGIFISEGEDSFGNPSYKVEVLKAEFSDGDAPQKGSIFSFNSSGALKKAMESISEGDIVKVIYKGVKPTPAGKFKGKPMHDMTIMKASSNNSAPVATSSDEDLI